MTNEQLYLAVGVPMLFNAFVVGLAFTLLNARMSDGFSAINERFDDMRDLWRAELRRVEEIIGARLKHLEERS